MEGEDEGGGGLAGLIGRWAVDARIDDAAASRAQERWLRQAAAEDTALAGLVAGAVHHGVTVHAGLSSGREVRGRAAAAGPDHVVLAVPGRGEVLVPLGRVAVLRATRGRLREAPASDIAGPTVAEVLARLAASERRVRLVVAGGAVIEGEIRAVGRDVVAIHADGAPPSPAHVALDAIDELWLPG